MSDFLKGNFKVKRDVAAPETKKEDEKTSAEALTEELRKKALASLGGSMVYVDRSTLVWDGDDEK